MALSGVLRATIVGVAPGEGDIDERARSLPSPRRSTSSRPERATRARAPGGVSSSGRPWPRAAGLAVGAALLAGGTWSFGHVSGDILIEGPDDAEVGEFFRPARLAELRSVGTDGAEALAGAADDAAELQALRPAALGWVDLPGALVLGEDGCEARYAGLKPLDLPGRVEHLRDLLAAQGLRADAFAEALRGLDPERQPTPEEALGGPLAGWFVAHLEPDDENVAAISRVELRAGLDDAVVVPAGLRGPAVFEQQERRARASRLGVALVVGAWLSAFLTWLAARRLSTAITAGLIAAAAQAGALLVAVLAGFTAVTLLVPPLLLVGALAADGAARACRPVPEDSRPGLALACVLAHVVVGFAARLLAQIGVDADIAAEQRPDAADEVAAQREARAASRARQALRRDLDRDARSKVGDQVG